MNHSVRIIGISAFMLLFFSSAVMQSVADTQKAPVLISKIEQDQHIENMKGMTASQKAQYRNEQYEILRKKAAMIGYDMPDTPPWAESEAKDKITEKQAAHDTNAAAPADSKSNTAVSDTRNEPRAVTAIDDRHQKQLEKYRKEAAEKRIEMQERLEKQRQSVKERIAKLVEKNALTTPPEAPRMAPPPPVARPFVPPPPMGPAYPPFYRMPPALPPPGYRYYY